ncbi:MAG: hypothetical protein IPO87_08595 [Flavobacteriales bacterium]|nr:hypothetical protein [Flavobacteriales bacterium]
MTTPLGGTKSNLTLLMDKFTSEDTTSSRCSMAIKVKRFDIHEFHYSFYDRNSEPILRCGLQAHQHHTTPRWRAQDSPLRAIPCKPN